MAIEAPLAHRVLLSLALLCPLAAMGQPAGSSAKPAAALAATPTPASTPARAPAAAVQTLRLPGLAEPAQILVDTWGVPHLYARSEDDVFFVQGFNAARDRLFQIDLWRRRGLGLLASVLGPNFVEQDRAARLFLYRGDMAAEWRAYGPRAQRITTRFVAGINAYIDLVAAEPARLPFEFSHFGYRPEKWQPEDVVRIRSHGLTRNLQSELWRAMLACRGELKADELRAPLSPAWQTRVPEGLDACIAPEALRVYGLATQGVAVSGRAGGDGRRSAVDLETDLAPTRWAAADPAAADALSEGATEGSNAWVVAPARTATGRPLLASDPHRLQSAPSLRYIVHLNAPGLNVIGGGEPVLPGVSLGHNGHIAFGLTILAVDQEDLYVYELNPASSTGEPEVRHQGRWERLRTVKESIPVRGGPAQTVELQFTRHGPVTHIDRRAGRAYAVRSTWFEPGTAPYMGSLGYLGAKDLPAFRRAMAAWGAPAVNQVYADVAGNIAWVTGGFAPKRPNWDGLLPVPGDGRYEWAGFWPGEEMPSVLNPAAGWVANANEMNLPAAYPYRERKLGFEWPGASRYQRLAEVLSAQPKHSVEDALRLQNDVLSVPARRLQPLLARLQPIDPRAQAAVKLLGGWNLQVAADSAAAALFEVWWSRHLGPALAEAVLPRPAAALLRSAHEEALLAALEKPEARFGRQAPARRDELLEASLAAAWADLQKLAGADPAQWQWGRLHHAFFPHALANAADAAEQPRLHVGPLPGKAGGSATPNLSSYDPTNFRHVAGPSFRMVLDVGAWDNARAVNAPGQSGDPASPHYRDLAPMWLKGETFPLLYSRERVEAATAQRFELLPAGGTPTSAAGAGPRAGGPR